MKRKRIEKKEINNPSTSLTKSKKISALSLLFGIISFFLSLPFFFVAVIGIGGVESCGQHLCAWLGILSGVPCALCGLLAISIGIWVKIKCPKDPFLIWDKATSGIIVGGIGLLLSISNIILFAVALVRIKYYDFP